MRKDAQNNKQRIERKAHELFQTYGVTQVSMNQIANALGMGIGTLYRHFGDKGSLCYQITHTDFYLLIEDMQRIAKVEASKREIFIHSIDLFLNFKLANQAILSCVENTTKKWSFKETDIYQTLFNYYLPLVGHDLNEMLAKFKVDALLNTLSTQNYEFQHDGRGLTNKQIRDQLVTIFFDHNYEE